MRRRGLNTTAALSAAVVVLALLTAPPASGAVLKSNTFQAFNFSVTCGVQLKELGGISCFSRVLPSTELDGYIELKPHGAAALGERGDSPWRPGNQRELKGGQKWRRAGVTCEARSKSRAVECRNLEGNGFLITRKAFAIIGEA